MNARRANGSPELARIPLRYGIGTARNIGKRSCPCVDCASPRCRGNILQLIVQCADPDWPQYGLHSWPALSPPGALPTRTATPTTSTHPRPIVFTSRGREPRIGSVRTTLQRRDSCHLLRPIWSPAGRLREGRTGSTRVTRSTLHLPGGGTGKLEAVLTGVLDLWSRRLTRSPLGSEGLSATEWREITLFWSASSRVP